MTETEILPRLEQMSPIPANSNPYRHDHYNQGVGLGERLEAMFDHTERYVIIVNKVTGQRVRVVLEEHPGL